MNPGELKVLVALARIASWFKPATQIVEIGCNNGRTAKTILSNVESIERYIGIEVPQEYRPSMPVQQREWQTPGILATGDPRFELWVKPLGSLDCSAADFDAPVDMVFIDGDHSRKAVEYDTALARAIVRPGGLIVWHDYHELGTVDVKSVLDEEFLAGATIQHVENTWIAFQRFI